MSARDTQVGGTHYKKEIQPWDIIDEYQLNFYEGNALKYLLRAKSNRLEDINKAIHYLEKEKENEMATTTVSTTESVEYMENGT